MAPCWALHGDLGMLSCMSLHPTWTRASWSLSVCIPFTDWTISQYLQRFWTPLRKNGPKSHKRRWRVSDMWTPLAPVWLWKRWEVLCWWSACCVRTSKCPGPGQKEKNKTLAAAVCTNLTVCEGNPCVSQSLQGCILPLWLPGAQCGTLEEAEFPGKFRSKLAGCRKVSSSNSTEAWSHSMWLWVFIQCRVAGTQAMRWEGLRQSHWSDFLSRLGSWALSVSLCQQHEPQKCN